MGSELAGKVALITGGASGIGKETARMFVSEGASIMIADVSDDEGARVVGDLGPDASFVHCDVTKADHVDAAVAAAISRYGKLDIMFNNAGIGGDMRPVDFLEDNFGDFDRVMKVDLLGVLLGCKFAGRAMTQQGFGAIINTASVAAIFAGPGIPAYRAAKAGVINVTRNAAMILGRHGVRVNAISPGPVETPILLPDVALDEEEARVLGEAVNDILTEGQALRRMGQPSDIAHAAVFLGSDRSVQITGQNLAISGGAGVGETIDRLGRIATAVTGVVTSRR